MDKGSFDDVTSFILRRHQINLCLSLLVIHRLQEASRDAVGRARDCVGKAERRCAHLDRGFLLWKVKKKLPAVQKKTAAACEMEN